MRVLEERNDIAYAKLFFKKSGYITAQWYPYFLSVRRRNLNFAEAYLDGTLSREAKMIYDVVDAHGAVPLHTLKLLSGLDHKENKSRFDRALTELQDAHVYYHVRASAEAIQNRRGLRMVFHGIVHGGTILSRRSIPKSGFPQSRGSRKRYSQSGSFAQSRREREND